MDASTHDRPAGASPDAPAPPGPPKASAGPRIFGGVLLALGLFLLWEAWSELDGEPLTLNSPQLAPIVVTALWVVFAAIFLVRQLISPSSDYPPAVPQTDLRTEEGVDEEEPAEPDNADIGWRAPILLAVLLVAYALVLDWLGFLISSTVFFFLAAWTLGSRKLWREAVIAVLLVSGVYFACTQLLDISLPEGVLPL